VLGAFLYFLSDLVKAGIEFGCKKAWGFKKFFEGYIPRSVIIFALTLYRLVSLLRTSIGLFIYHKVRSASALVLRSLSGPKFLKPSQPLLGGRPPLCVGPTKKDTDRAFLVDAL
jgi:hypothetical protein